MSAILVSDGTQSTLEIIWRVNNSLDELEGLLSPGSQKTLFFATNFVVVSDLIKRTLKKQANTDDNPYNIVLGFCLETLYEFLQEKQQEALKTHVVVECRGKKEDNELELEFRRLCDGSNRFGIALPFDVIFSDKKALSSGLQLADLVARPIGLSVLRPEQSNRAFHVLTRKFFCDGGRNNAGQHFEGRGLRIFPSPESEKPR